MTNRRVTVLDEAGHRAYEGLVRSRLPDIDVPAWALFTFALGTGRRAEGLLARVVRPYGLDGSQLSVLLILWMSGPPHRVSPTFLSRTLAQSPSGMTHTVKRLTTAGLVTRISLESDGRAKHVELTAEGREVVARCAADLATATEVLFPRAELPVEELANAQRKIVDALTRRFDAELTTGEDAPR